MRGRWRSKIEKKIKVKVSCESQKFIPFPIYAVSILQPNMELDMKQSLGLK